MAESKVTSNRLQLTGTGAVNATALRVSNSDLRTIKQALDDAGTGGGGGGNGFKVEYITLDSTQLSNLEITLGDTPAYPTEVVLLLVGGPPQKYGVDFVVSGDVLSWDVVGSTLITDLQEGDDLIVIYSKTLAVPGIGQAELIRVDTFAAFADGEVEDPTDLGNGVPYYDLINVPADPDNVTVFIAGGSVQVPNLDYQIIDDGTGDIRRLSWESLPSPNIGDVLTEGTIALVIYGVTATFPPVSAENITVDSSGFSALDNTSTHVQQVLEEIDDYLLYNEHLLAPPVVLDSTASGVVSVFTHPGSSNAYVVTKVVAKAFLISAMPSPDGYPTISLGTDVGANDLLPSLDLLGLTLDAVAFTWYLGGNTPTVGTGDTLYAKVQSGYSSGSTLFRLYVYGNKVL